MTTLGVPETVPVAGAGRQSEAATCCWMSHGGRSEGGRREGGEREEGGGVRERGGREEKGGVRERERSEGGEGRSEGERGGSEERRDKKGDEQMTHTEVSPFATDL